MTASVTDPLVHAVVGSFLVLDPHSWNFAPFNSIYTKSRKNFTAELHMLLKLHGRKRGDWASEELVHEDAASVERAFPLNRVSLQLKHQHAWTHGGATDAQRQLDMLSTCSHSSRGNSNTPILILSASAVRVLRMLFHYTCTLISGNDSLCQFTMSTQYHYVMWCYCNNYYIVARYCQG